MSEHIQRIFEEDAVFMRRKLDALNVLNRALVEWEPEHVYALFSGGGDSMVSTHIASQHPAFDGCLFIDTGTAFEGVREHIDTVCDEQGWPLWVTRSPKDSFEDMIVRDGLPGPGQHGTAYVRLKERALDHFTRILCGCDGRHGEHKRVIWISGARTSESKRRMQHATEPIERDGSQIWVNLILDWTAAECAAYRERCGLRLSEVAELAHRSGECNCGTMAEKGERNMLRALIPGFKRQVDRWENLALEHGHHHAATWGQRPLRVHRDQQQLIPRGGKSRACSSCEARVA